MPIKLFNIIVRKVPMRFTEHDLSVLLKTIQDEIYPSPSTRKQLAKQLGYSELVINRWFCKYRSKLRAKHSSDTLVSEPTCTRKLTNTE